MVDHGARAKEMRRRAQNCQVSAENSKSEKFADCYRLLAQNYDILATVEEEFVKREILSQNEVHEGMAKREILRQNEVHEHIRPILESLNVEDTQFIAAQSH